MFTARPLFLRSLEGEDPTGSATPPAAENPPVPTPPPAAPAAPAAEPTLADRLRSDPEWGEREIERLRRESTKDRLAAKESAADEARKDLSEKIAVALGLKPDAAADPAALTASLTAAQQKAQESERKLAVFTAANGIADPAKLLDRASFLSSIAGIDPSDGAAIKAAIDAAIAADQTLKATRAVGASTVDTPGGPGEQGQITEAQLAQMTPEQINEAFEKGLLRNLLT